MIGEDGACALFPSWMCRFLRNLTFGVVLVVLVLLLKGIDHCSETFLLLYFFFLFRMCTSAMPLEQCVVAEVV
jgi:hypothetical protein